MVQFSNLLIILKGPLLHAFLFAVQLYYRFNPASKDDLHSSEVLQSAVVILPCNQTILL